MEDTQLGGGRRAREGFTGQIALTGVDDEGASFTRRFTITDTLATGAGTICYRAFHGGSPTGVLKELYPDSTDATRCGDGTLDIRSDPVRFTGRCEQYLRPYRTVAKLKREHPDLGTFLPSFEIYERAPKKDGQPPVPYIWVEKPATRTFADLCRANHEDPEDHAGQKVLTALRAVRALTGCVCVMHRAGLLHRDIKPSNFGFVERDGTTLPDMISLFDMDSVCTIDERDALPVASAGFTDMKGCASPSPEGDIYSIGASLFCALAVDPETEAQGGVYQDSWFGDLDRIVRRSRLLGAVAVSERGPLQKAVTRILKRSLGPRGERYASCEDLEADLDEAIYSVFPYGFSDGLRTSRWVLENLDPLGDDIARRTAALCIGTHLYQHPVLPRTEGSAPSLLICGFDSYAQTYLDTVLQLLELPGVKPTVRVLCDQPEQKTQYLSRRPALGRFFQISGKTPVGGDEYGSISFVDVALPDGGSWAEVVERHAFGPKGCQPTSILVSLGDDGSNREAAAAVDEAMRRRGRQCPVSFLCAASQPTCPMPDTLVPVPISPDYLVTSAFGMLDRLAFNVHLLWEKSLDVDLATVQARFRDPDNYYSSFSSALALFYRLLALGVDLRGRSCDEAAERYAAQVLASTPESERLRDELIAAEHRRWVAERLCAGWGPVEDMKDCVAYPCTAKVRDKKQHGCMLRSGANHELARLAKENPDIWHSPSKEDVASLDDLDKFSLAFHLRLAEAARKEAGRATCGGVVRDLRGLCADNPKAMAAFDAWHTCMVDISNGQGNRVRGYEKLKNAFADVAGQMPQEQAALAKEYVSLLDRLFRRVLEAMRFQDFKAIDAAIVDGAPFILTYTLDTTMFIPLHTGGSSALFGNVAAPTIVNPATILYAALLDDASRAAEVRGALLASTSYIQHRSLRAQAKLLLACPAHVASALPADPLGSGLGMPVRVLPFGSPGELRTGVDRWLVENTGTSRLVREKNSSPLSYLLQGSGFYGSGASYRFDSRDARFIPTSGCDFLGYIRKPACMTVEDMLSLQGSQNTRDNLYEYFDDYDDLWAAYTSDRSAWKRLCALLQGYSDANSQVAFFQTNMTAPASAASLRFVLPGRCERLAMRIARRMMSNNVISDAILVPDRHGSAIELWLKEPRCPERPYREVFSEEVLSEENPPSCFLSGTRLYVNVNRLGVRDLELPKTSAPLLNLLRRMAALGYISSPSTATRDGATLVSFRYTSAAAKELLTSAGKILELHAYRSAQAMDYFDDIVTGCEVQWGSADGAANEFDLILTKGFRSIFVECKATESLEQGAYYKLATLSSLFGVNATAVLATDTSVSGASASNVNKVNKRRGDALNIVTVDASVDGATLGRRLIDIMEC